MPPFSCQIPMRRLLLPSLFLCFAVFIGVRLTNSQQAGNVGQANWTSNPTAAGNERMLLQQGQNAFGANQIVLVDTAKQVMAVYWIAPDTGIIQLKSVRNLAADFQLEEFNAADPAPSKVRSILSQPKNSTP